MNDGQEVYAQWEAKQRAKYGDRRPLPTQRVIRIVGLINGGETAFDGQYLREYDPSRPGVEPGTGRRMLCHLVTTPDLGEAARYGIAEAFDVWKAIDARNPVRGDGKPNRPLTAFTVLIEPPQEGTP